MVIHNDEVLYMGLLLVLDRKDDTMLYYIMKMQEKYENTMRHTNMYHILLKLVKFL